MKLNNPSSVSVPSNEVYAFSTVSTHLTLAFSDTELVLSDTEEELSTHLDVYRRRPGINESTRINRFAGRVGNTTG